MSISRIGDGVGVNGTIYSVDGIETLALHTQAEVGDLIVVITGATSAARDMTVTDNRSGSSHTYAPGPSLLQASQVEIWSHFVVANAVVTTVTGTLDAALASPAWLAAAVFRATNGWDATVLGDSASGLKTLGASPAVSPATGFTTTADSSLVVAGFMPIVNETWDSPVAADSDTNNCENIYNFANGGAGGAAVYQILTATETDFSIGFRYTTGNAEGPVIIMEFQEAAAAGGGTIPVLLQHYRNQGLL